VIRARLLLAIFAAFLAHSVAVPAQATDPELAASRAEAPKEQRVLFIGNSYTKFNNLPRMVSLVAEGLPEGTQVRTFKNLEPGATLRHQWLRGGAVEAIQRGGYTHVVIQAHSLDPFDRPGELEKYARLFRTEISKKGARPVLYETWARRDSHFLYRKKPELGSPAAMTARLEQTYGALARDLSADLAPVGRAFHLMRTRFPSVELYKSDGTHPSEEGSYLASCVMYGVLTGQSPEGTTFRPFPMDPLTAQRLQRVAAESLRLAPPVVAPGAPAGAMIAERR
jgi:hypothetical protein